MQKAKQLKLKDSNIELLGSAADIESRVKAAKTESAWANAGKEAGMQIWRIENFGVVPVPPTQFGSFYSGDSYIILKTVKVNNKLRRDLHFWLGATTSQDESGTAAYKTVELDDLLGGEPVQHREVQDHESDLLLSYFPNGLKVLEGGIDSAFNPATPDGYRPRLLHIKGVRKAMRVREVPLSRTSLNEGDCFILDAGLQIFQWNGEKSGPFERTKASNIVSEIKSQRGKARSIVMDDAGADQNDDQAKFWELLGGKGPIKSAAEGGTDADAAATTAVPQKQLFRVSDASGELMLYSVDKFARSSLNDDDAFIVDTGDQVFAWIGRKTSQNEKRFAVKHCTDYLVSMGRPVWTPITRVLSGEESSDFNAIFA